MLLTPPAQVRLLRVRISQCNFLHTVVVVVADAVVCYSMTAVNTMLHTL